MSARMKRLLVLTLVLLLGGSARAEMLMFATAGDCAAAPLSSFILTEPHAVVLQKSSKKEQQQAREALSAAGVEDVTFLSLMKVKESARTEAYLTKQWATDTTIAQIASLLRQHEDDTLLYYAAGEADHAFLHAFADTCAGAAADPTVRDKKQKQEEYVRTVSRLVDGVTGEERSASAPDTSWQDVWGEAASPALPDLPATDAEGFLTAGTYLLEDEKGGTWAYITDTLRIVITKHTASKLSWYEADIRRKPEGDTLHMTQSLNGKGGDPAKIASENRMVLALNADYYQYRINYKMKVGLIIRDGEVVRESAGETTGTSLPPLDTLLLDDAGNFRVDKAGELDSESALALGARDVLSFGPILIRDGRVRMMMTKYRTKKEPRTAIGCIGPNHYLAVVAEGRLKNAPGFSLDQMAQLMATRGCTAAINLDGGHTSALLFMGQRLNKIGNLSGTGTSAPRNMSELLGIGTWEE